MNAKKNTAIRIKMSDGSVVVDEERATKKAKVAMTNSLDGRMLAVLDAVVAKTAVSEEQRKAQLEGDLSEKYNLVQSIMTETDEAEALKEGKKAEKEELQ